MNLLLATEANLALGALEERGTVRVQALGARSGAAEALVSGSRRLLRTDVLEKELGKELDKVHGEVPDDVPDPDDTNPTTLDRVNVGEAPVTVSGNDGRDELSKAESTHKSERGALHPRETVRTGNEDKSLSKNGDLEVHDHVQTRVVGVVVQRGNAKLVLEEGGVVDDSEERQSRSNLVETVERTAEEELGKIPVLGLKSGLDSVEREGHDGTVVQEGNDKNHEGREIGLPDESKKSETDNDTDGNGSSVGSVVLHTTENDTRLADSLDDGGKTGLGKDNVGSTTSSIGSTLDGNTDVGTGKSRSIVGTVTSHGSQVTKTLKTLNDLVLVLGEDTGETVDIENHLVERLVRRTSGEDTVNENLGVEHAVTKTKTTTGLLGNSELITGNHLDANTESLSVVKGLLGVVTGRVKDSKKTKKLEAVTLSLNLSGRNLLEGDGETTKTTVGELLNVSLKTVLLLLSLVALAEVDDDGSHTLGNTLDLAGRLLEVSDLGTLVNRVEGLEVKELDTSTGVGRVLERTNNGGVDSILVLSTRSVSTETDDIVNVGPVRVELDELSVNSKLVGGEGTGLVRAENVDTGELLDGSDTGNDGLVLGELLSTDGEGNGKHTGHSDGDTTDQEHKDVVDTTAVAVAEASVEDKNLENDEETDGDHAEETNAGKDLLQVTSGVIVRANKGSGTTEEGVGTRGDDDTLGLTLLADGTGEALVTDLLANGKRFTGKRGLVTRNVDGVKETAITGNNVTDLESDNITGNKVGRFDFDPLAVTLATSLGCERVHESLDGVTSVALLDETNGGVDEEEENDTDEVLPIGSLALTVGESDGDDGGTFHDPGERVPHEGKELKDRVGLLGLNLVGTEDFTTTGAFLFGETAFVALEEGPNILKLDGLDVNLGLVVEILGLELDGAHVDESVLGAAGGSVLLIDVTVLAGSLLFFLNIRHVDGVCMGGEGG